MGRKTIVLLLLAMTTIIVSCQKQNPTYKKAQLVLDNDIQKTGDDDDEPIIHGKVKKKVGLAGVNGAKVETVTYSANELFSTLFTDALGDFTEHVKPATYYFKVTVPGVSSPYITDPVLVENNVSVTILVD